MKPLVLYILLLISCSSCKELYYPEVDTDKQVLVVDGLITNENTSYLIKLAYTVPFDAVNSSIPISGATVSIVDQYGNTYHFYENIAYPGSYLSNPSEFIGVIGNEYKLSIITSEGDIYESGLQKLLANPEPVRINAEKNSKKTLITLNGLDIPKIIEGASLFLEFNPIDNKIPRFRFKYASLLGYERQHIFNPNAEPIYFNFYGWRFRPYSSDFIINDEKYQLNSSLTFNYETYFFEKKNALDFLYYEPTMITRDSVTFSSKFMRMHPDGTVIVEDSIALYPITKRILYQKQYRLNDDSYNYYKEINTQLNADNKIFDPASPPVTGNIFCTSDPEKIAFGFFETSSVIYAAYELKFISVNGTPVFSSVPYILPNPNEGITFTVPDFWND